MGKRALCVGVNKYPRADLELRGCVNDARAWATLLREQYDFASTDVKVLTDRQATKAKIHKALGDLLAGSKRGDVLVFTNSSHGTYRADKNGDESLYDEAMCPYDCETDLLIDDELRELFTAIPDGVRLTVISDSCHSGSVTRDPGGETPDRRRKRWLDPKDDRPAGRSTTSAGRPSRGRPSCTRSRACASCSSAGAAPTSTATTPGSAASSTAP